MLKVYAEAGFEARKREKAIGVRLEDKRKAGCHWRLVHQCVGLKPNPEEQQVLGRALCGAGTDKGTDKGARTDKGTSYFLSESHSA